MRGDGQSSISRPMVWSYESLIIVFAFQSCVCVGIVLVHDLTNRKSHSNLSLWLSEFYRSRDSSGE